MTDDRIERQQLNTPIGRVTIEADDLGVRRIYFGRRPEISSDSSHSKKHLQQAKKEIEEYFSGLRKNFEFPVRLEGTDFQKKVWKLARRIPFGKTWSYKELAERVGDRKAARAVGSALKKNPIPIAIPCHRIIASNGDLTGFAGGMEKKEWLIEHEL